MKKNTANFSISSISNCYAVTYPVSLFPDRSYCGVRELSTIQHLFPSPVLPLYPPDWATVVAWCSTRAVFRFQEVSRCFRTFQDSISVVSVQGLHCISYVAHRIQICHCFLSFTDHELLIIPLVLMFRIENLKDGSASFMRLFDPRSFIFCCL